MFTMYFSRPIFPSVLLLVSGRLRWSLFLTWPFIHLIVFLVFSFTIFSDGNLSFESAFKLSVHLDNNTPPTKTLKVSQKYFL